MGITPCAVSLLALINDHEDKVEVLIDRGVWQGKVIQLHLLVDTVTLVIAIMDMVRFIEHSIQFMDAF